jgi:hypothetical protein
MLGLLHGEAGAWDELAIAVAALAVLWIAVKLAGRKSTGDDEADEDAEAESQPASDHEEQPDTAHSSPTKLG